MDSLPGASDGLLIVEIAHSSISFDRGVKVDLYARHAIPEVWLLDLMDGELLVSRKPVDGQYRTMLKPLPDETISSLLAPQLELTLERGKSWSVPFLTSSNCVFPGKWTAIPQQTRSALIDVFRLPPAKVLQGHRSARRAKVERSRGQPLRANSTRAGLAVHLPPAWSAG